MQFSHSLGFPPSIPVLSSYVPLIIMPSCRRPSHTTILHFFTHFTLSPLDLSVTLSYGILVSTAGLGFSSFKSLSFYYSHPSQFFIRLHLFIPFSSFSCLVRVKFFDAILNFFAVLSVFFSLSNCLYTP